MRTVDDLAAWLDQQMENQRHAGDALKALATALPAETGQLLSEVGAFLIEDASAKRRILDEHAPEWQTVEWPHDQNGKGEAPVCRRCQNAEHTEWNPPAGQAGALPEGFVAPYVIWPCPTARLLALPYADRSGYRDEWQPE